MIYLKLFITFLEIGLVSFGGGYGMIALIREKVLINNWLTESEFLNFVGIAESTPGPIAVNMATFVGSSQAGVLGSLVATIGVVLPSFIIILIIASIFKNLLKYEIVKSILGYIKPAIVGLIIGTGLLLFINTISIFGPKEFDYKKIIILGIIILISLLCKIIFKKKISPILLIILSGILGIILYL